jgi:Anthrone oxygenase
MHAMARSVTEVLLWLFVINHGIAFGAGLYETRIVVASWLASVLRGEDARLPDVGTKFWAFVTTVPLTLLTLASLVAAWQTPGARGAWWLGAAAITLVERLLTFIFFIPTMLRLQRGQVSPASAVKATARRWVNLNHVRSALSLAAWIAALWAFSLPA